MSDEIVILKENPSFKFSLKIVSQNEETYLVETIEQHPEYNVPYYIAWHHKNELIFSGKS